MVFEETITIECFLGGLTIAINGFTMVFDVATIAFNGFRWFPTIGQTMRWFRWIVVVYGVPDVFLHSNIQTFRQYVLQEAGDKPNVVVATFETSALELLFPFPQLRGPYCAGVDVDLLMEPTRDFPGIIAPKVITNKKRNKIRLLCCQHAIQSAPY